MDKLAGGNPMGGVYSPTGDSANFSYWNTINPIALLTNGNVRVPEFVSRMFGGKDHNKAAVVASNVAGSALLAAGLVGAIRTGQWLKRMRELDESDDPANNLNTQLGTTFVLSERDKGEDAEFSLPKKKRNKGQVKNSSVDISDNGKLTWGDYMLPILPVGATILAAVQAYKGADDIFDSVRNKSLTRNNSIKSKAVTDLIKLRAQLAKGTVSPEAALRTTRQIINNDNSGYTKQAGVWDELWQGTKELASRPYDAAKKLWKEYGPDKTTGSREMAAAAVLVAALFGASAYGSYMYNKADNPNNMQFKAFKKGLREYAKNKTGMSPVHILTPDRQLFRDIEGTQPKQTTVREEPEVDYSDINRPMAMTF